VRAAAPDDALLAGALAFAEGRQPAAAAALARVEPTGLPTSVLAQVRLTEGVLFAETAPDKARAAFAEARLLAPGTLVEESALRREVLLHGEDTARMAQLASSYIRRFGSSPFASAFISRLAFAVATVPPEAQEALSSQLDAVLAPARAADKQAFYAILARSTLVSGNHVLARAASARAMSEPADESMLLRARLYAAALAIASDDHVGAAQELHSLTRAPLDEADRDILLAAISVARELRRWPFDPAPPPTRTPLAAGTPPGIGPDMGAAPTSAAIQAAEAALDATRQLTRTP
jgi:chemotaxis protein MotC